MQKKGVQVIDGEGRFCLNCSNMESLAKLLGMNLVDDVHVVGIIGSQQKGKSTLLNGLFGTEFKTSCGTSMAGLERCTDGILMAGSSPSLIPGRLLIVDVEGVDGIERPNNEEFEGKATLFTLAVAEVLIVNMNFSDIGTNKGGNYPMLEAVFKAALKMDITHGEKTTLLFALRDYKFAVQISNSLRKIQEILENIWRNIAKPDSKKNATLESYFRIEAVGLPNLMPEDQPTTNTLPVDTLRKRFSMRSDGLFGAGKNYQNTRVFLQLLQRTWDLIRSNQVVGIFSIRQCIAKMDCDKASHEAQENLARKAEQVIATTEAQKGTVDHRMECRNEKRRLEELFTAQAPREFRDMYAGELVVLQGKMQREVEKFERDYDRVVDAAQTKRDLEAQRTIQAANAAHLQQIQQELVALRARETRRDKIDEVLRGGDFFVTWKNYWHLASNEGKMKVVNCGSYVELRDFVNNSIINFLGVENEKWVIVPRSGDYFTIGCQSSSNSVLAIDTLGRKFMLSTYTGSEHELLSFERV